MRCALAASEGLCWRGGAILMLASSAVFFMLVCHYFINMKILLLFRWRADLRRVDLFGGECSGCLHDNQWTIW